ncbi:MAG TPA: AAA family ATPase, partial [Candidatus Babeliales bacterium]|nr:AAA family ATPase [Candidatus Babeliales bacterium]
MKINTTYLLYLFTYLFLTNTSSPLLATAASCTIDGMVGKQPERICERKNSIKRAIRDGDESLGRALLFYGPSGTGKKTAAKKMAKQSGAEFIVVNVSDGANSENVKKLFKRAENLADQKKHVIVIIEDVDKITNTSIGGAVHMFLNGPAAKLCFILAIATATDHSNFDDRGEKKYMEKIYFNLPNTSERKQYIMQYINEHNLILSKVMINTLAATTLHYSYGDLEKFLIKSNYFISNKKYLPFTQGFVSQMIQNSELRNRAAKDLLLS